MCERFALEDLVGGGAISIGDEVVYRPLYAQNSVKAKIVSIEERGLVRPNLTIGAVRTYFRLDDGNVVKAQDVEVPLTSCNGLCGGTTGVSDAEAKSLMSGDTQIADCKSCGAPVSFRLPVEKG